MVKSCGRSILRQYMPAKPNKYGIKLWSIWCTCCGYSLAQDIYLGSSVESVGGRKVVTQLSEPYLDRGHVIYCDRFFTHLDLAAYLRSRHTGMLEPLLSLHSHLTWPSWSPICIPSHGLINGTYTNPISPTSQGKARNRISHWKNLSVLLSGWTKSIALLTRKWYSLHTLCQQNQHLYKSSATVKIFAMKLSVYTPADCKPAHTQGIQLSYRWGDKHDRLVGQHAIPFTAKRGYIKIFFYILDSTVVNAWILYKTVKQAHSQWNSAAQRRHTLSWFKESVILSLCG